MYGCRAIVYFGGRAYSPVYGHNEWLPNITHQATCAIGCNLVPSDQHQGCGFHSHFKIDDTIRFVEQIRGGADFIAICEFSGKIAIHEKGLRAEYARIVGVVNYFYSDGYYLGRSPVFPFEWAVKYFRVPLYQIDEADRLIRDKNKSFT